MTKSFNMTELFQDFNNEEEDPTRLLTFYNSMRALHDQIKAIQCAYAILTLANVKDSFGFLIA